MQDLNITLIQADQVWEDKKANFGHFEELLSRCGNTDLILLPEMFHTGFSMNVKELAESVNDSSALQWLKEQAAKHSSAIYASFIAEDSGNFYNRGAFVLPSGEVTFYDKRKCFGLAGEADVFTAGENKVIVDYKGWKINLQICYDLRFPENCRNGMLPGGEAEYDLLLYVANWPGRRIAHWKALLPARAIENQCFVAAVNRVGTDPNDLTYPGESGIWSALGEQLVLAPAGSEKLLSLSVRKSDLEDIRKRLPFLKDKN